MTNAQIAATKTRWGVEIVPEHGVAREARFSEHVGADFLLIPTAGLSEQELWIRVALALAATQSIEIVLKDSREIDPKAAAMLGQGHRLTCDRGRILTVQADSLTIDCERSETEEIAIKAVGGADQRRRQVRRLFAYVIPVIAGIIAKPEGDLLFAEDLATAPPFRLGSWTVTEQQIIDFAEMWDPLDMHVDAELAAKSPIGLLCASGMHTLAILQRLAARAFYSRIAVVAGKAGKGPRMLKPVTAGMTLSGLLTIEHVALRASGRAVVTARAELYHGKERVVEMTGDSVVLQRCAAISESVTT